MRWGWTTACLLGVGGVWACGAGGGSTKDASSQEPTAVAVAPPAGTETGADLEEGGDPPVARPEPSASDQPSLGIPACDEYLELYERCESRLQAEIMAGDRRTARVERGWLAFEAKSLPAAVLASACEQLLASIRDQCS